MSRLGAIRMVAACLAVTAASGAELHATTDHASTPNEEKKSKNPLDRLVPIPSYSADVEANGCRVRASPQEAFTEPDADIRHIAFKELIGEAVGRYSVRAILDHPVKFDASLQALDADTRTLVLLETLRDGLGRDGLHTFFFMSAAQHAPAIRDALKAAGMLPQHELFERAMALFGPTYPVDNDERAKRFAHSSLDTPLNDFDKQMMVIAKAFGPNENFEARVIGYVERTPALWQQIEGQRARLGETARLRLLNQAILARTRIWDQKDSALEGQLAAMPKELRTLLVMNLFNGEFENGGVHQFFFNSTGAIAPEVHAAFLELGLPRQAAIYQRALDMFKGSYPRDTQVRREKFFAGSWSPWDEQLQRLTDDLYALDGGPTVVRYASGPTVEGGPGIWQAMTIYAREKKLLPC